MTLFGIIRRTLLSPQLAERYRRRAFSLASVSALIWLVHPLQTASVTYIFQRSESVMGLFYLLTLHSVIRYIETPRPRWFVRAVLACLLGMASKAVMVTAPIVILIYDRAFFANSWQDIFGKRGKLYIALALTWILLVITLTGPHPFPDELLVLICPA